MNFQNFSFWGTIFGMPGSGCGSTDQIGSGSKDAQTWRNVLSPTENFSKHEISEFSLFGQHFGLPGLKMSYLCTFSYTIAYKQKELPIYCTTNYAKLGFLQFLRSHILQETTLEREFNRVVDPDPGF
jgi:hypothetical protein